ncbi:multidrug MFS transporter [Paenibacillus sp. FSL R7-0273]|uniref:staphylopine family metallophore export MFS transporter CntE n=1 Tax=Paenibacillus sp. FSL R7-0273 TaxID=1536772 RepID=UPI0004F762BD|nr:MFS transporter [Paenibacillus sp. FSL R7-0273]AIQ47373.1 multidrug MFS transporter [Paenibacillus sp. FSL R7-0273]OMF96072.1 MFS transporter [Paenibacillus sp. FSL R7-0273]
MKGVLAWPFLRLYLLTFLYFSANSILNVIIPLKGESLGASNSTIGVVMGAYLFTTMFLRPWAGQVIYRQGPVKVLRIILLINAVALSLYTFTGLGGYFFARMLQGICTAFFSMSLQLGIIDSLPEKDRSQGISMYSLCASLPGVIGPLMAVNIWETGSMSVFSVTLISMAVLTGAFGFSATMKAADIRPVPQQADRQGSFSQLFTNPHLFLCSILMLGSSVVFGGVTTFIPLYAGQIGHASAALYLMLQAGMIVAARFFLRKKIPSDGKWHPGFVKGIILSLTAASLCTGLSGYGGFAVFYCGALLMGLAQAMLYPTLTTYLTFVLPESKRNVQIGLFIAMADLGVSLGGVMLGPVADLLSYSWMYMICAILGAGLLLFISRQQLRLHHEN